MTGVVVLISTALFIGIVVDIATDGISTVAFVVGLAGGIDAFPEERIFSVVVTCDAEWVSSLGVALEFSCPHELTTKVMLATITPIQRFTLQNYVHELSES